MPKVVTDILAPLGGTGGRAPFAETLGEPRPLSSSTRNIIINQVVSVSRMKKTPPNRRGITFEVGAQLEARDSLKNWYAANIEKIDYEDEKVLIHYRQWSHRYDEWFDWASPYLRPLERIQLRREGLQDDCTIPGFHVNEKVLASWSDCRFYPAKVLAVNKDASYTVKFYDGVVQTVKGIHVKPFIKEKKGGKPRSVDQNKQKASVQRKHLENRGPSRSKRGRRNGSEQDGESETEDEASEDEEHNREHNTEEKPEVVQPVQGEKGGSKWEKTMKRKLYEDDAREEPKRRKKMLEKNRRQASELANSSVKEEEKAGGEMGTKEGKDCQAESEEVNGLRRIDGKEEEEAAAEQKPTEDPPRSREIKMKQDEEEMAVEDIEEERCGTGQGHTQGRRTRSRVSAARWTAGAGRGVLELRKRKVSLGQMPPSKRSKPDTSTEKAVPTEPKSPLDPLGKNSVKAGPDSVPGASTEMSNDTESLGPSGPVEGPPPVRNLPKGERRGPSTTTPARRQANNPNRFSREPLYRVIKNQPPPVTFINLDHNPFKCQVAGCLKSFRKAKLLHYHMKYYHSSDQGPGAELSPTRSIHTRAHDRQAAASPESPKRRRTISASMHSSLHSPHRTPQSPRGNAKGGAKPVERRRTSAPPAVHLHNQHRLSLREKTKENHLEKVGRRSQERVSMETAFGRERDRPREKQRDFLRIKLKKRKKKQPQSDEASGSDTSTDSLGWSEDDLGEELDVTSPPEELHITMGARSSEVIRCVCEVEEENDFMVQCQVCLCSQHGACMGLLEDGVPGRYTCYICREPPGQRQSQRYWCDRDWLSSGHMYGLPFLEENYSHQNAKKMAATHQLLGDVHRVVEVLNGLQLKMSVLQSQTNPDLKLWRQPWKQTDKPKKKGGTRSGTVPSPLTDVGEDRVVTSLSSPAVMTATPPPQQASYISSEHCYQKPRAYYPAVEQRLVVETRAGSSDLEHSLRSTEDLLALERHYGTSLDPDCGRVQADRTTQIKEVDRCTRLLAGQCCEVKSEDQGSGVGGLQQQWQANLLDHIEAVQDEVTHRMDFIERELDVLESWLDYTGELEPPEPLARLPQLKHRIKQLLSELAKVQQIAHCCAT
ncbi:PHD finger protein 20-like [Arapaima gigas]